MKQIHTGQRRQNHFDRIRLALAVSVLWSHSFVLVARNPAWTDIFNVFNGQAFLGGCAFQTVGFSWRVPVWTMGLAAGALACAARFGGFNQVEPIAGSFLLMALAHLPIPRWNSPPGHGDWSYGIYLYAWPVQQLWVHYLGKNLNPYALIVLTLLATVPLAAASWRFVESEFLRHRKQPETNPAGADSRAMEVAGNAS